VILDIGEIVAGRSNYALYIARPGGLPAPGILPPLLQGWQHSPPPLNGEY